MGKKKTKAAPYAGGPPETDTEGTPPALPARAAPPGRLVPADPLQRYLERVRGIPRLSPEEEHQLAVRVHKFNDPDAALQLITSNLYLAVSIAFEFRHQFQNMLDLVQEGNIGLMRAIKKFDPFKGVRLPTYAAYWVRAYILKYILDNWRLVRVGTTNTRRKLLFNLNRVTRELKAAGVDPSPKMLAERFSTSEEDVEAVRMSLAARDVSMEAPVDGADGRTWAESIGSGAPSADERLGDEEVMALVRRQIDGFAEGLKESERAILYERLMSDEPAKLAELGERFGVTREAIRQSETRLIKRLKAHLEEHIPGIGEFGFSRPGD